MVLTDKEINDFTENPLEFINNMRSDSDDIQTLRNCIIDFIHMISNFSQNSRKDYPFTIDLFNYSMQHLENSLDDSEVDNKLKDVLLVLLSWLSSWLTSTEYGNKELNQLFSKLCDIISHQSTEIGHQILIHRVLSLFEDFWFIDFNISTLQKITKVTILKLVQDTDTTDFQVDSRMQLKSECIHMQAAILLPKLLMHQEMIEECEPIIDLILHSYISLAVHKHDEILYAFQDFLNIYSYCVQPCVIKLCDDILYKCSVSRESALYGWLCTLEILLNSITFDPASMEKLEVNLIPFFRQVLEEKNDDWVELVVEWLSAMTNSLEYVSPSIVSMLPVLLNLTYNQERHNIAGPGFESFPMISTFVCEIIEKDPNALFNYYRADATVFDSLKKCIHYILDISGRINSVGHTMASFKLIRKCLTCTGRIDTALTDFIQEISIATKNENFNYFHKLEISEWFNDWLSYNSELTFDAVQSLESSDMIQGFLKEHKVEEMDDEFDYMQDIQGFECKVYLNKVSYFFSY